MSNKVSRAEFMSGNYDDVVAMIRDGAGLRMIARSIGVSPKRVKHVVDHHLGGVNRVRSTGIFLALTPKDLSKMFGVGYDWFLRELAAMNKMGLFREYEPTDGRRRLRADGACRGATGKRYALGTDIIDDATIDRWWVGFLQVGIYGTHNNQVCDFCEEAAGVLRMHNGTYLSAGEICSITGMSKSHTSKHIAEALEHGMPSPYRYGRVQAHWSGDLVHFGIIPLSSAEQSLCLALARLDCHH